MPDIVTPFCTWAQFTSGAFADLARNYTDTNAQNDLLIEATRLVEGMADERRLAPFTNVVETHRLDGLDPDEYTDQSNLPLDLVGTLGRSYAMALGASTLVRHCWLNEYAPRYTEMWTYGDITVDIARSYGGSQLLTPGMYLGPYPDSGHIWFNLGLFIPIGSYAVITYSGGYTVAIPADLQRACKLMVAALLVRELVPNPASRDPEALTTAAAAICKRYAKGGNRDEYS